MKSLFYVAIGAFVLYLIFKPSKIDLAVDNPSDNPITVTIDELAVEVPPSEVVWVEMGKGNHTVTLEDGSAHDFDYQSGAYFLNPTKSSYLITEHFFGTTAAQKSYELTQTLMSAKKDSIEYMGITLPSTYGKVDDLITKVTWDVGARETVPESVQVEESADHVILKKLMDPNEFWQAVFSSMGSSEEG